MGHDPLAEHWIRVWLRQQEPRDFPTALVEAWVAHRGTWRSLLYVVRELEEFVPCFLLGSHLRDLAGNPPTRVEKEQWERQWLEFLDYYMKNVVPDNPATAVAQHAVELRITSGDFFPCDLVTLRAFRGKVASWDLPWDLIEGAKTHRGMWDALEKVAPCILFCLPFDPPTRPRGRPKGRALFANPVIAAVVAQITYVDAPRWASQGF